MAKLQTLGLLLRDTIQVQLDALEREGITGPIKVEDSEINWNPRGDVFIFRATLDGQFLPTTEGEREHDDRPA